MSHLFHRTCLSFSTLLRRRLRRCRRGHLGLEWRFHRSPQGFCRRSGDLCHLGRCWTVAPTLSFSVVVANVTLRKEKPTEEQYCFWSRELPKSQVYTVIWYHWHQILHCLTLPHNQSYFWYIYWSLLYILLFLNIIHCFKLNYLKVFILLHLKHWLGHHIWLFNYFLIEKEIFYVNF